MKICRFCNKVMRTIDHNNQDLFDVYLCEDCLLPDYSTRYRELWRAGEGELLAVTIKLDEYYVVINHAFNFVTKRTNFSLIYKNPIVIIPNSLHLEPITWNSELPACDVDYILDLPFHDPTVLKRKLGVYVLFS
jgi:hypothetical protein